MQELKTKDLNTLRKALRDEISMIDLWINAISGRIVEKSGAKPLAIEDETQRMTVTMILLGAGASCRSILKLTKSPDLGVRDAFILSRGVLESLINVCYILAEGSPAARLADQHARQKAFRDLSRTLETFSVNIATQWSGIKPDFKPDPDLSEALANYTNSKGGEIPVWTKHTILERLNIVSKAFGNAPGLQLGTAYFAIYRHSSELIHGTFFGAMYFFGRTLPGKIDPKQHIESLYAMIFIMVIQAIEATGYCIFHNANEAEAWKKYKGLKVDLSKLGYIRENVAKNTDG